MACVILEMKPNSPNIWNKKPVATKMCHICMKMKKTKEHDKLDLCNECMDKVLELV
jgi:hypothetical protein